MFALKRTSLGSVLDCVAPCLEESLLSLAKLRLEEVWKSFTGCIVVWFLVCSSFRLRYCLTLCLKSSAFATSSLICS